MKVLPLASLVLCAGCAVQGDLVFVNERLDFGLARPGVERVERVQLTNRGDSTLVWAGADS
jgi:hypothetical protein